MFLWLAVMDKVLIEENMQKKLLRQGLGISIVCGENTETIDHLQIKCMQVK